MQYQKTREESAIAPAIQGTLTKTEVQTLVQCQPLQAQSYAPVSTAKGDPLPLFIGGVLLAALVAMAGIHLADGEKRELQAQNAQLAAQQAAIAGCIQGVMK